MIPGTKHHNNGSKYVGLTILDADPQIYRLNYIRPDGKKWGRPSYEIDLTHSALIGLSDTLFGATQSLRLNKEMIDDAITKGLVWMVSSLVTREYTKEDGEVSGGKPIGQIKILLQDVIKCPVLEHLQYQGEFQYDIAVYTNVDVYWFRDKWIKNQPKPVIVRTPTTVPPRSGLDGPFVRDAIQLELDAWWQAQTKGW